MKFWIVLRRHKYIFTFIISQHSRSPGGWNHSPWQTRIHLLHISDLEENYGNSNTCCLPQYWRFNSLPLRQQYINVSLWVVNTMAVDLEGVSASAATALNKSRFLFARLTKFDNFYNRLHRIQKKIMLKSTCPTDSFTSWAVGQWDMWSPEPCYRSSSPGIFWSPFH